MGALNDDGSYTPIATGLGNSGREAFLPMPEPAGLAMLAVSLLGLVGLRRRAL